MLPLNVRFYMKQRIVYIERVRSKDVVNLDITAGSRLPCYCTALGKAILAFLAKEEAKRIVDKLKFVPHTPLLLIKALF
ncbi:MAG TPA: hypothetical protein ENI07_03820 [Desulfobacterales bacterium]|nr:hypothetical protein [Desulfobacterales bacterium]